MIKIIKYIFIILMFFLGIYFICKFKDVTKKESFVSGECQNVLIQEGNDILLYNKQMAKIPGVNPIKFNNLEEYVEFLEWHRSHNIRCPVLYFQKSIDVQGNDVYAIRPSPTDLQGGIPHVLPNDNGKYEKSKLYDAGRDDPPFNSNSYPAYDKDNQYIGLEVPLDEMKKPSIELE